MTTDTQGTGTITDDGTGPDGDDGGTDLDDDRPQMTIGDVTIEEGSGATFAVTVGEAEADYDVTFTTSTNGSAEAGDIAANTADIVINGTTITPVAGVYTYTVPAGTTGFNVTVPTIDDAIYEGNETFELNGKTEFMTTDTQGTGTITDDDTPTITVTGENVDEGTDADFTVTLSNATEADLVVSLAPSTANGTAEDADIDPANMVVTYVDANNVTQTLTVTNGTVTVPGGITTLNVAIPTNPDSVYEGPETFDLTASSTLTGSDTGTSTILDDGTITDDDTPTITVTGENVDEGTDADFTVTLSNATEADLVVSLAPSTANGTAEDADIDPANMVVTYVDANNVTQTLTVTNGTVTVPGGITTLNVAIPTNPDSVYEGPETFDLTASSTLTGSDTGTSTITDTLSNTNITMDEDGTYTYSLSDFNVDPDITTIRINELPLEGSLLYDNHVITKGYEIDVADIGLLTFKPDAHESGSDQYDGDTSWDNVVVLDGEVGEQQESYAQFNYSVNNGSEWSTVATMTVDVNAVADAPDVVASTTQTISIANVNDTSTGFKVSAIDENGDPATISIHGSPQGFGVTGDVNGDGGRGHVDEISYDTNSNTAEQIIVEFEEDLSSVNLSVAWNHSGEDIAIAFYKDGNLIETITTGDGTDGVDDLGTIQPSGGQLFDEMRFYPPEADDDFLIHSISYNSTGYTTVVEGEDATFDVTSALVDIDDSEQLSIALTAIPEGATISDGTYTFTASAVNGTEVNATDWDLTSLTFNMPNVDDPTTYIFNVVATSTEYSNNETASTTVPLKVHVLDTMPLAINDVDSVGLGGTAVGNVITGAGGDEVNADTLGKDAVKVSAVSFDGNAYTFNASGELLDSANNVVVNNTITADHGTLQMNSDGSYSYTSTEVKDVISHSGSDLSNWTHIAVKAFNDDEYNRTSTSDLDLTSATGTVSIDNNRLGVSNNPDGKEIGADGSGNDDGEALVFTLNTNTKNATIDLNALGNNESAFVNIYKADGTWIKSETFTNTGSINISSDVEFNTIVVGAANDNAKFRVDGVSFVVPEEHSDVFTYTLEDADGDTSDATLTINQTTDLTLIDDTATVYESGLAIGTDASATTELISGNLLDNDSGVGSDTVITAITGDNSANGNGILTANTTYGTITVYTQDFNGRRAGDYDYELTDVSSGDNVVDSIVYTTEDGSGTSAQATLRVSIVDDAPIGTNIESHLEDVTGVLQTTNLMIVLDRSGSMAWNINHDNSGGPSRMEIAKEALASMFDSYDNLGNVNIKFVDFAASNPQQSSWFSDDVTSANNYLDGLNATGGTWYDDALNMVINNYDTASDPVPTADKNLVYFISDGEPNGGHAADEVDSDVTYSNLTGEAAWTKFLEDNSIDISFGIGISEGVGLDDLQPIAFPNTNDDEYAMQVLTAFDLKQTLLNTVSEGVVQGDASVLISTGDDGIVLGADGGVITSVVYNGVTYDNSGGATSASISTLHGGTLDIDFITGTYFYTISSKEDIDGGHDIFTITATDGDGDSKSVDLDITLDFKAPLDANRDEIITNVATSDDLVIDANVLTQNDSGTNTIDSTSNPIGGTLGGTTQDIIFDSNGSTTGQFQYGVKDLNGNEDKTTVDVQYQSGNTVTGTSKDEILIGREGQVDTLNAGAGDDHIDFEAGDTIDGGTGYDAIHLNDSDGNISFDAATIANITNIEAINLEKGKHEIEISLDDVLDMTEAGSKSLDISALVDDGDSVSIVDDNDNWGEAVEVDNNNGTHSFEYTATDGSGDSITLTVDDKIDTTGM